MERKGRKDRSEKLEARDLVQNLVCMVRGLEVLVVEVMWEQRQEVQSPPVLDPEEARVAEVMQVRDLVTWKNRSKVSSY